MIKLKKFKKFAGTVLAAAIISVCGIAFMPKTTVYAANYKIIVENGYIYAIDEDGNKATGWKTIDDNEYFFGKDGVALSGGVHSIDGHQSFYFDENGVKLNLDGWQIIDGNKYYFRAEGYNCVEAGHIVRIDGYKYYFDENGIMQTGLVTTKYGSYYFDEEGHMQTGFITIDDKVYYFGEGGDMQTGFVTIDDKVYYFNEKGHMQTGFATVDGNKYYLNEDNTLLKGWQIIDSNTYYFNESGVMQTGWQYIDGEYYFDENGILQTGWQTINGYKYYLGESGTLKGWQIIDDNTYYFNSRGVMYTGYRTINNKYYEFSENGVMLLASDFPIIENRDFCWYSVDGVNYWYENGCRQGTEGRGKEIYDPETDAWYWLDSIQNGAVAISKDVYQESNGGKWVRYDADGHMVKGWDTNENGTYYFDPITGAMAKGVVNIFGTDYRFDENTGIMLNLVFVNDNGNDYWYENGIKQGTEGRGREIYDPATDAWYWLDAIDGGKKATSKDVYQESNGGKWVRYDADGHMIKGWQTNENGTYYFDLVTGAMTKGSAIIDNNQYDFDTVTGITSSVYVATKYIYYYDLEGNLFYKDSISYLVYANGVPVEKVYYKGSAGSFPPSTRENPMIGWKLENGEMYLHNLDISIYPGDIVMRPYLILD